MIRENEILALLGNEIPGLQKELEKIDDKKSPYKMVRCFGDFTCLSIEQNKFQLCKKCLKLAEKFFLDGDRNVRNAIENVYMGALSRTLATHGQLINELSPFLQDEIQKHHKSQVIKHS